MAILKRGADNLIRYVSPTRRDTGAVLDSASGAVVTLRMYIEEFEMVTIAGETRTRSEVASGLLSFDIPHFDQQWIEVGDVINWFDQYGNWFQRTLSSVTVGTGRGTPATNFDQITWTSGGATTSITPAGTKIFLVQKLPDNGKLTVKELDQAAVGFGLKAEVETDIPGLDQTISIISRHAATPVMPSEDGEVAPNQDNFLVLALAGMSGGSNITPGNRVRVKLGSDQVMSQYGDSADGDGNWGWETTLSDTLSPTKAGYTLRLVATCVASGGTPVDVESIIVPTVEPTTV
jgi:hypothetical protein